MKFSINYLSTNINKYIHVLVLLLFGYAIMSFVYKANKFDFRMLQDAFNEHGGAFQSVPREVINVYILAQNKGLERFAVEGSLRDHPLLQQRVVEFLYPRKVDPQARDLFGIEGEVTSRDCRPVAKSEAVILYECPHE